MRTFEFKDATSNKFWNIELSGSSFTVNFGRIGTNGQAQTKTFASDAVAKKEHDKLVAEKLKKGYVETTSGAAVPKAAPRVVSSEQKALEAALVGHADEVAAHSAYGDYLMEQGDPRGELVQVQLALEDESRPKAERDDLRKREAALLKAHAAEWLGDAGRFLVGAWSGEGKPYGYRFARGWPDLVRMLPFPGAMVEAISGAPEVRLLRRLEIVYDMQHHPFGYREFTEAMEAVLADSEKMHRYSYPEDASALDRLAASPYLANLRALKFGFSDDHPDGPSHSTMIPVFNDYTASQMLDVLKACPRLEELYVNAELSGIEDLFASELLGNLRVFQYYYGTAYTSYQSQANPYPLSALAQNKSLKHLHTLRFHPGRDAVIDLDEFDALVNAKTLPALRHLQVHMTRYGDGGADRLVDSGILKRLRTLDIGYGNMTDEGARKLAACPDLKGLEVLNVSRNALTAAGVRALKATGVQVVADGQHDAEENYYLYEVDRE